MTVVVTCGPAWEPLDGMRRLTNASTGALGAHLADAFALAGHRVLVLRGEGATAPPPARADAVLPFGTNDEVARLLDQVAAKEAVGAVFHAAALCDYRVAGIRDAEGRPHAEAKIPSRAGTLLVELEPATKVLPRLRRWFPSARLCGWKFELNGGRDDALAAARRQMDEADTDACVVNGAAWGPGFGLCERRGSLSGCPDAASLATTLQRWLAQAPGHPGSTA